MPSITIRGLRAVASEEDGGMACIIEVGGETGDVVFGTDCDPEHVFVRIQSWDELRNHPAIKSMEGKELVVTISWNGKGLS